MQKYTALLRGINVSGQKLIKMEALRKSMEGLGLKDVSTYIQSGNILFASDKSQTDLGKIISKKILEDFGFEVETIVLQPRDLEDAIAQNPFAEKTAPDSTQPYIGFLSKNPAQEDTAMLKSMDFGLDEFRVAGKRIYLWYADSAGKTKLSNAVVEKKLRVVATMRNWKTVNKLLLLASG